jgi:hypothetical protein
MDIHGKVQILEIQILPGIYCAGVASADNEYVCDCEALKSALL